MPLFYQPQLSVGHLTPEESHHAVRVLRMAIGDRFELTDGKGTLSQVELRSTDSHEASFTVISTTKVPKRPWSIHLAIAPTKNIDRMEWMVEKVVEIGVDKITFVKCAKSGRPTVPLDRLNKLVISAMKQSRQAWLPDVRDMVAFNTFLGSVTESQPFIAHVDSANPDHLITTAKPGGNYVVLVGPEGDFTSEEIFAAIAAGFKKVSLGSNRLRTETAGLYSVAAISDLQHLGPQ